MPAKYYYTLLLCMSKTRKCKVPTGCYSRGERVVRGTLSLSPVLEPPRWKKHSGSREHRI